MKNLIILIIVVFYSSNFAQIDFLPTGLGLEIGVGYNQLKVQEIPREPFFTSESLSRDAFKLTPTFRLSWEKKIINNFLITPFISYSVMGGKLDKRDDGYEDEYTFKTLDLGLFASYRLNIISLSIGSKYNRFLDIVGNFYPPNSTPTKSGEDMSWLFKKWSVDLGGRASYSYYNFTLSLEGWFSISELINKDYENIVDVNSKRFQLLVGYRL